jgi:iron complex outermembrane receptor protein
MILFVKHLEQQNRWLSLSLMLAVAAVIAAPDRALAQDEDGMVLEEILVTAQRREESMQDVPVSVSAFSGEDIEKAGIREATDYLMMTPNVGFSEDGEGGSRSVNIAIRGVSNIALDGISAANSIGYYIDELSVGAVAQGTINPQLQDMERIEVLRGPQGTFFGRNAVGGAVNITTRKPEENFFFEGSAMAGNFGTWGLEGIINVPFSDKFMMRAVVAVDESDTPLTNINSTGNNPFYEYQTARVSFRAMPTDKVTLDLSITQTNEDEGGDIAIPSGVLDLDTMDTFGFESPFDAIDTGPGFYPDNVDTVDRDTKEWNEKEFTIINGRITVDWDRVQLKSITGFVDSSFARGFDIDGISLEIGPLPLRRVNDYSAEAFSQEFRLQSTEGGTFDWTVGLYYAKDKFEQHNEIQILPKGSPNASEPAALINANDRNFEFESQAVFADVTWHASDTVDIIVGGRYSKDDVSARDVDANRDPADNPVEDKVDFTDFSPRFVVRYMPNDELNLYASASKGYKAGGTDVTSASRVAGAPFKSEDLWSYELGFKSRLADGRVSLSGAVFALEWKDFQVQSNQLGDPGDISSSIETTQNAEKASATGFELELLGLAAEGLTLGLNIGYADATFDDFKDARLRGFTNGEPNIVDVSGKPLPRTPEWTYTVSADYGFEFGSNWDGFVRADWSWVDKQYSNIEAVGSLVGETVNGDPFVLPQFPYEVPSYNVANLSGGVSNDNFRITAYVKNLSDEQYYTGTADNFGAAGMRLKPHFRTYGIKFTYMTN